MQGKPYNVYAPAEDQDYMLACNACGTIESLGQRRKQAYAYAAAHDCRPVATCLTCGLVHYAADGCTFCAN